MKFWILFYLLSSAFTFAEDQDRLKQLLNLDRFTAYIGSWASVQRGKDRPEIAQAMQEIKPQEFLKMGIDPVKLADAKNYDGIILDVLNKRHPELKATAEQVNWGYNFLKMKMNEGFVISPIGVVKTINPDSPEKPIVVPTTVQPTDGSEILLNVGDYSANRTTRAVFWEATESQRKIEMFVGTARSFKQELVRRGSKILALVNTQANNYNPILLIQDPGEKSFHYAISEIAGQDRLSHLGLEASILGLEWTDKKAIPPIFTVESAEVKILRETDVLTKILNVLPRADHVVIGQKGAFERTFDSLGKIHSLIDLYTSTPTDFDVDGTKFMTKVGRESEETMVEFVMKYASDIDKIYEKQIPSLTKKNLLIPDAEVYTMDRASYQMADRLTIDQSGKVHRWRLFSNMWGDEIKPIAAALKATGYNNISYIGTAGALPSSGLKPGDLVMPQSSLNSNGVNEPISSSLVPSKAKSIKAVAHVGSPFEETEAWLKSVDKSAQAVEVETKYLATIFNGKDDKVNIMLLISDVVGSKDENLSTATSSVRRNAQINAISTVINNGDVVSTIAAPSSPTGIRSWIKEIVPNRDPASAFQLYREATLKGITTRPELEAFIKSQKSFTTAKLETFLDGADYRLASLAQKAGIAGALPDVALPTPFVDGRFNPSSGPVEVYLHTESPAIKSSLEQIVAELKKTDPDFAKYLTIKISNDPAPANFTKLPQVLSGDSPTLLSLYEKSALAFGGLAVTETRTGGLKFVPVTDTPNPLMASAFYKPDDKVAGILKQMRELPDGLDITKSFPPPSGWGTPHTSLRQVVVDSLPDGELAQIVPILDDPSKNLVIELRITKEGLKNPAVIAEEFTHLTQIMSSDYGFSHPYEWAETVANARRGSLPSLERLARMEVDAMKDAQYLITTLPLNSYGAVDLSDPKMEEFIVARRAQAEDMYAKVNKDFLLNQAKRNKAWDQMKIVFDKLEKDPLKLNDLILKNDRQGVRKLIETYLPWDLMEPAETNAWRTWLDAMVNPDPKRMQIVFRGMDDYPVLKNPSGQPGIVSTVLSKNQGNYTRRLRSLTTLRERFGGSRYMINPNSENVQEMATLNNNPSVLEEMKKHATDPRGSPFISVSDNNIANRFGYSERVALRIDERRLVFNAMSFGFDEKERLIPLVIFPDEVLYYQGKANLAPGATLTPIDGSDFQVKVEKALGRPLKPEELSWGIDKDVFLNEAYERTYPLELDASKLPTTSSCMVSGPCDCVYKTLGSLLSP